MNVKKKPEKKPYHVRSMLKSAGEFFDDEAARLGFSNRGSYFNYLAMVMKEHGDQWKDSYGGAAGDEVREESRPRIKKA